MPSTNKNSGWYHRRQAAIDRRRVEVTRWLAKGLSRREIVEKLKEDGFTNPETEGPYTLATIHGDCQALTKQWRKEATKEMAVVLGQQLSEIREARRTAWLANDLNAVYRGMELEIKLLGTAAPEKSEVSGPGGTDLVIKLSWDDPRIADED